MSADPTTTKRTRTRSTGAAVGALALLSVTAGGLSLAAASDGNRPANARSKSTSPRTAPNQPSTTMELQP